MRLFFLFIYLFQQPVSTHTPQIPGRNGTILGRLSVVAMYVQGRKIMAALGLVLLLHDSTG